MQLFLTEKSSRCIFDFKQTISEKHHAIAFLHRRARCGIARSWKDSYRRTGPPATLQFFGGTIATLHMKRRWMPGVSKAQLRSLDVGYDIKTGREHGGIGLLENEGERAIDPRQ